MHKDDVNVLEYIKDTLGIGKVNVNNNKCVFTITNTEGIYQLISIFDPFPLNSSKYLDFVNFKKAFELYLEKDNSLSKKELADRIIELKNSMNTKRTNTILPKEHKITITKSWLLGFIEGDGSFFISRKFINLNHIITKKRSCANNLNNRTSLLMSTNFRICTIHRFRSNNLMYFSTTSSNNENNIKPIVIYNNADTKKLDILRDNDKKSGIYC